MSLVIFYEKPGCRTNARQKALLSAAGHEVDARDLLTTVWTADSLRPFFGDLPVLSWINMAAPAITAGEINPARLSAEQALALMVNSPILIRRPLLQVGEEKRCGFDVQAVQDWIGLEEDAAPVHEGCSASTPHRCNGHH